MLYAFLHSLVLLLKIAQLITFKKSRNRLNYAFVLSCFYAFFILAQFCPLCSYKVEVCNFNHKRPDGVFYYCFVPSYICPVICLLSSLETPIMRRLLCHKSPIMVLDALEKNKQLGRILCQHNWWKPRAGLPCRYRVQATYRYRADRSVPRSLQRWVSTKSSISQLTFFHFLII